MDALSPGAGHFSCVYTPVGELAEFLNARENPWKPLLVINAGSYFDDSGTHRGSVVAIIAGYVATKEVWQEVEHQWRGILGEFQEKGVHCFHATECLAQAGQFKHLEKLECHYVYEQLSDILESAAEVQPILAAVSSEDKIRDMILSGEDPKEAYLKHGKF